jgi:adhesin transport system membrane fusion protein
LRTDKDANFVNALRDAVAAETGRTINTIFIIMILFFSLAITWAAVSEIDELTRGEGKVIPSEKIQKVQALDGGIITTIFVKEGVKVKKDQPLMIIDATRFAASLDENKNTYLSYLATSSRLKRQMTLNPKDKLPAIDFPEIVQQEAEGLVFSETALLETKTKELVSSLKILENQLGQKVQELIELRSNKLQQERSMKLINDQIEIITPLIEAGATSKVELLKLQKELNDLQGQYDSTKISIPKIKLMIEEAKNKIIERLNNFRSEAATELSKVETEIKKYEAKLISDKDKIDKTVLKSPVNGVINKINVSTIGGVVKSGEELIEIVPDSDILLVEAKIKPKDIGFINPTQKVIVKITAYDFAIYGGLNGTINEISADTIQDPQDDESYYKVTVKTSKNYLEKNGKKHYIIPGMLASVDIVTGKKTILDFILKPLLKTKQGAFHER